LGILRKLVEIALEGIGRIEVVGGVCSMPSLVSRRNQPRVICRKAAGGDVVTVEDGDIGCVETRGSAQVDVAGLGRAGCRRGVM